MKRGDRVVIKHPDPLYSERNHHWQIWEVVSLRSQGRTTRLRGLCVRGTELWGLSPSELQIV